MYVAFLLARDFSSTLLDNKKRMHTAVLIADTRKVWMGNADINTFHYIQNIFEYLKGVSFFIIDN